MYIDIYIYTYIPPYHIPKKNPHEMVGFGTPPLGISRKPTFKTSAEGMNSAWRLWKISVQKESASAWRNGGLPCHAKKNRETLKLYSICMYLWDHVRSKNIELEIWSPFWWLMLKPQRTAMPPWPRTLHILDQVFLPKALHNGEQDAANVRCWRWHNGDQVAY